MREESLRGEQTDHAEADHDDALTKLGRTQADAVQRNGTNCCERRLVEADVFTRAAPWYRHNQLST